MNVRLMTSAVVLATVATLGLGEATTVQTQDRRAPRNLEEFDAMFREYSNWGRWGADDERGTLSLITPAKSRQAAALVRSRYHCVTRAQSDARRGSRQPGHRLRARHG